MGQREGTGVREPVRGFDGPLRIVLAGSQDVVRCGMRGVLAAEPGFRVVGDAATVDQACRCLTGWRPDVILTDSAFADGTVVDVCRHAREVRPPARVVVVSRRAEPEIVYTAVLAGASAYLLEGVSGEALVDAVHRVAAGQALLDPGVTAGLLDRLRRLDDPPWGDRPPELAALTRQERRILDLIVDGFTNREIGGVLTLSEQTVKNHVTGLLAKLGVTRRAQAAAVGARVRRRSTSLGDPFVR